MNNHISCKSSPFARAFFRLPIVAAAAIVFAGSSGAFANDSLTVMLPHNTPLLLIKIPGGSFMMGSPDPVGSSWNTCDWTPPCDKPAHTVSIAYSFYLGKYEITQEQWAAVMDTNPSTSKKSPACPVENVSWNDCRMFCMKVTGLLKIGTFRLPSESEWEYACRAGTTTRFFFGDSGCAPATNETCALNDYAWWSNNNPGYVQPVGLKKPNPWGLYDILGNVYEWCQDNFHMTYNGAPADGTPWMTDSTGWKSIRGSWRGYAEPRKYTSFFRARHENYIDFRHDCCGMRIAFVPGSPVQKGSLKKSASESALFWFQTGDRSVVFFSVLKAPVRIYDLKGSRIAEVALAGGNSRFTGEWKLHRASGAGSGAGCFLAVQEGCQGAPALLTIGE